jgi:hypothetical protein
VYREFFESHGVVAILYRPDFRIFAAATEPAQTAALVRRLHDRLDEVGDLNPSLSRHGASA